MFYIKIRQLQPLPEIDGYMEVYQGVLQRLTDLDGNEINPTSYTVTDASPTQPAWALPDPPEPPPPPPPVPEKVTKAQFITQLIRSAVISEAQGIQAATIGEMPSAVLALFAQLDESTQLEARIAWATLSEIRRDNGFIALLEANGILSGEQMDDIFRAAGQITT